MILGSATSFGGMFGYLTTGANWRGSSGFLARLVQHLGYSGEALGIALVVGLPLGLLSGHTGRGGAILSMLSNASRALPTLGVVTLLAVDISVGQTAAIIPLIVLAIPAVLVNTYIGVRGADRTLVDAAVGMGLRPAQVLVRVEIPVALPLILLGIRTAALQVVATATILAFVGLGGLGRFIIDGQASRNFAEIGAGSIVIAALALLTEALFVLLSRLAVSPGVRARIRTA